MQVRGLFLRQTLPLVAAFAAACSDDVSEQVTADSSSSGDPDDSSGPGPGSLTTQTTTVDTSSSESTSSEPDSSGTPPESSSDEASSSIGESSSTSGGPSCGDDSVDGDEVCDGTDLAGSSCAMQGFTGGTLDCLPDCSDFDTTACTSNSCGDDMVDGTDVCDGTDLGGADCESAGFDAGTLACADDCSELDTSGCIMFSCGNGEIDGDKEACDVDDLGGSDCVAQGFPGGGTLACSGNCTFDTSACIACGDGIAAGAELCDGDDVGANDCVSEGFDGGTLGCAVDCTAFDTSTCDSCGDGVASGPEACDGVDLGANDCISEGFEAGTLGCQDDCSFDVSACSSCGDGVASGDELCDGDDLLGADCTDFGFEAGTLGCDVGCGYDTSGCSSCGDAQIGGAEQCDGANLGGATCTTLGYAYGALACSTSCGFAQVHCVDVISEVEPNDDGAVATATNDFSAGAANGPYTSDVLISAAISPAGDDDVFAVSNPGPAYATYSLETFGPVIGDCAAPTDTVVEVRTAANVLVTSNDESGINSCSLLSSLPLAPGQTVYVRVIDFQDNDAIAGYHLHVRIDPVVCGDGIGGAGEQCDDGGLVAGDGCSSTCTLEVAVAEIEPNANGAQADATGIVIADSTRVTGSIPANGDVDRFRIELATAELVRFETFTTLGMCNGGTTTTLRLFDAAGTAIITDAGPATGSGIAGCAALTFPLAAGTYYVQVEETGNNAVVPSYVLEVAMQDDTGIETEPNEDQATASTNLATGTSNVYVFGDHMLSADSDVYAIEVPVAGSSLRLELVEGDRAVETCESNGVDSRITLFDAVGTQLVDDDDDGRGFCSQIDGTGAPAADLGAHNLAAGTYYVQVRQTTFGVAVANTQFIYRLAATIRRP